MRRLAILLFLVPIALSAASLPPCLSFGFLAEEGGEALIVPTYERLLETAGSKLDVATLEKVLAAKDPFAIPETGGTDLHTLNQHLKAFARMLEQRGWAGESVRAALLEAVLRKRHGNQQSQESQRRADERQRPILTVPLLNSGLFREGSPDGNWVVVAHVPGLPVGPLQDWTITSHNLRTGETKRFDQKGGGQGEFRFSNDGRTLFFAIGGYHIQEVPFHEGVIDWANAKIVGEPEKRSGDPSSTPPLSHLEQLRLGGDSKFVYGVNNIKGRTIFRFDRTTGKRVTYALSTVFNPSEVVQSWEVSPREELVFQLKNDTTNVARTVAFTMDDMGKLSPVPEKDIASPPAKIPQTKLISNGYGGGTVWYLDGKGISRLDPATGQVEQVIARPRRPLPSHGIEFDASTVFTRPGGLAILYEERMGSGGNEPRKWLEFWDPKSGYSGMKELPAGTGEVQLTPDGNSVIAGRTFKKDFKVIPVDSLLGGGP